MITSGRKILEINNLTSCKIDGDYFNKVAKLIFRQHGVNLKNKISVAIVDDKQMKFLNRQYLKRGDATDVLSFLYENDLNNSVINIEQFFGEIIICRDQAILQAKQRKISLKNELTLLLAHGILHLLGYNDESENDRRKMDAQQRKMLNFLKIYKF